MSSVSTRLNAKQIRAKVCSYRKNSINSIHELVRDRDS
jgi:hypothetical protein